MKMGKHSLLMMAGCGLMVVGLLVLPALGVKLGGVQPLLFILACPLSMMFMMGSMGKGHDHSGHGTHDEDGEEAHGADCHPASSPSEAPAPRALPAPGEKE